ncbi:MAG: ABC transporter substrate-binding protein [Myxococcales bacterium]|nr:ABC transporter substrate-binding protein [Myxococcales bacterium]USN50569.1 MAG: ABC transporter substrate-binding protein [Myxococcales bacterium]
MKKIFKNILLFIIPAVLAGITFGITTYFVFSPKPVKEYKTLHEITDYANTLPEQPPSDDNNWLDPYYVKFDESRLPAWPMRFLAWLKLGQSQPWSPQFLASQMIKLSLESKKLGREDGSKNIIHIKANGSVSAYIFGDVQGAFHSMVRNLNYLKKRGVINNELEIIEPKVFFVFNGDYIDRSAYNVDSLILMTILLEKNPERVIYLPGNHEYNGHWEDFGLKRELFIRGRALSHQEIPFKRQVLTFFKTLPQSVYISGEDDTAEVIRISFHPKSDLKYDESAISTDIVEHEKNVENIDLKNVKKSEKSIDVIASFQTENWRLHNRIKKGLGFLDQDHGASAWAVLSSPILVHKKYLDFHSDAFVRLDVGGKVSDASITLFHQDTRMMRGYEINSPLNVVTGKLALLNQSNEPRQVIKLASSMSLVQGVPTMGQMAKLGLNVAVNHANRTHENETPVYRLYIDNDNYIPQLARNNVESYLKMGIKYILFPVGTPTTLSYVDELQKNDALLLFPITGAEALRNNSYKNIINFRVGYMSEAIELVKHLKKEYGVVKFAFLYQNDSFGLPIFKTAVKELHKMGLNSVVPLPYTRGNISFDTQIKELQKTQPDALGFFCTAKAAREFIRQAGINVVANMKLFGISFAGELTIKNFAARNGIDILFAAVVPNPKTSALPIVVDYRETLDELDLPYDVYSLESYIMARLFIEVVENIGSQVTPQKVLQKLTSLKNYNFYGLNLSYNPKNQTLNEFMWLETKADEDWQRVSTTKMEYER